jgi:hypothetical protein
MQLLQHRRRDVHGEDPGAELRRRDAERAAPGRDIEEPCPLPDACPAEALLAQPDVGRRDDLVVPGRDAIPGGTRRS